MNRFFNTTKSQQIKFKLIMKNYLSSVIIKIYKVLNQMSQVNRNNLKMLSEYMVADSDIIKRSPDAL